MHQTLTLWNRAQFGDPWLIRDVAIPGTKNIYSDLPGSITEEPMYEGSYYEDYW